MSVPKNIEATAADIRRVLDIVMGVAGHPYVGVVWSLLRPHLLRQWTPEQVREFDQRQAEYDRMIADAQRRAGH